MRRIVRKRSLDYPLKGDKRRKDKHEDPGEGDTKENVVHETASPIHRSPATLLTTGRIIKWPRSAVGHSLRFRALAISSREFET